MALASTPFGLAFGVACSQADLSWLVAAAFSALVFTGGSQFAAVSVLTDGGTALAAVVAGLLLAIRSLAYGVVMAPALTGSRWRRAIRSQLMIDEAMANGTSHPGSDAEARRLQRYGYLWAGGAVFVLWNAATLVGVFAGASADEWITRLGIDATIPATFIALLWPRLRDAVQRWVAVGGAVVATMLIPFAPAGIPIIAASLAAGVAMVVRRRGEVSI
jgi:predicted branched-subunit amino acid permease